MVSIPAGPPRRCCTGWACSGLSHASAWPAIKHSFLPLDSPGFSSHPARTASLWQTLVHGFMCRGGGWEATGGHATGLATDRLLSPWWASGLC